MDALAASRKLANKDKTKAAPEVAVDKKIAAALKRSQEKRVADTKRLERAAKKTAKAQEVEAREKAKGIKSTRKRTSRSVAPSTVNYNEENDSEDEGQYVIITLFPCICLV